MKKPKRAATSRPRASRTKRVPSPELRVTIQIPGDAEFVRVVRLALTGVAARLPFSYDEIEDIKLAVSEACNNAIQHGAGANGGSRVMVECVSSTQRLVISVQDDGPGLRPPSVSSFVKARRNIPAEGGLGLYLMQALMDEVHVHGQPGRGTRVELVKYVKSTGNA